MLHRTTLALALFSASALAACGGEEKDVSKYVGNWTYMTGSVTVNCDKAPPMQFPLMGSFKVTSGADSDLATSPDMTTCNLKFDVSGTTATMRPNQFCMFPAMGMAPAYGANLTMWNFTTVDGVAGDTMMAGQISGMFGPIPFSCPMSGTGKLTKK